ncbi:hypothetical protein [Metallosphaera hakonensis]|uniref:hypothetical protein n=1 Tax=Metallosphaera hakonensis TaxID=79601 RepID=UPI000A42823F|nr:hypothetical protein [Metallosphaera hakonensis]
MDFTSRLFCINNEFTGALISGTDVVWLTFPRYDSPSVFGYLLDERAGSLSISGEVVEQEYLVPNVLRTVMKDGSEITDLLLRGEHSFVRKVIAKTPLKVKVNCLRLRESEGQGLQTGKLGLQDG